MIYVVYRPLWNIVTHELVHKWYMAYSLESRDLDFHLFLEQDPSSAKKLFFYSKASIIESKLICLASELYDVNKQQKIFFNTKNEALKECPSIQHMLYRTAIMAISLINS